MKPSTPLVEDLRSFASGTIRGYGRGLALAREAADRIEAADALYKAAYDCGHFGGCPCALCVALIAYRKASEEPQR